MPAGKLGSSQNPGVHGDDPAGSLLAPAGTEAGGRARGSVGGCFQMFLWVYWGFLAEPPDDASSQLFVLTVGNIFSAAPVTHLCQDAMVL